MDYEKLYKNALEWARQVMDGKTGFIRKEVEEIFPELKESEDEQHRKWILEYLYDGLRKSDEQFKDEFKSAIAWLEKQGKPIDEEKVLIGARKNIALSIINYLDNNSIGMCLSNMECEDIEDACVNSKWTKLYNYMKKKLEKQGSPVLSNSSNVGKNEQKSADGVEQKPAWSEEDDQSYEDVVWCINKALQACHDENEAGTCWFAQRFINSVKQRLGGEK